MGRMKSRRAETRNVLRYTIRSIRSAETREEAGDRFYKEARLSMSDAIKAEIKKLEDRRFRAMIDNDFDTLDKLLGDNLVYTHSTAQSDTRAEYIALCKRGVFKYRKIERPIENIQVYGDTVVVTGHTKMDVIAEGKPKQLNSRYTDVWIKGAKGWQMVVWQSTPIPASVA
jgi:ketosteroid isomerase-like protein